MPGKYTIITDGAYSSKRNRGGSAFIFLKEGVPILEWSRGWEGGSNNTAELLAIIFGLKAVKHPIEALHIVSDSQYSLGVMFKGWKRNHNKKILDLFDKEYSRVLKLCSNITIEHIRGHGKGVLTQWDKWNKRADYLAVRESQKQV